MRTGMLNSVSTCQVSPVLVGRADYLTQLDDGLAAARLGESTTVLIGGEAGVGKSRLIERVRGPRRRRGQGARPAAAWSSAPTACRSRRSPRLLRELVRELGLDGVAALLSGQGAPGTGPAAARARRAAHEDEAIRARRGPGCSSRCSTLLERLAAERAAGPGHRGRALGRPVHPGPAHLPDRQPAGHARRAHRRHLPVRRAAPQPPAAPAARRAGPGRLGRGGSSCPG